MRPKSSVAIRKPQQGKTGQLFFKALTMASRVTEAKSFD